MQPWLAGLAFAALIAAVAVAAPRPRPDWAALGRHALAV
jgi:hypothetical protein